MGGLSRFNPPGGFQPAGYLPAPTPARFISEAEQAAEKLPATIKSQSLKNALLKGGAKPLELEYAGIDDFISQNQGKPVSAGDVLAHLRTEGPLGQLKRVEQQVENNTPYDEEFSPLTHDEMNAFGMFKPPAYAENIRAPFDTRFASDMTNYHKYTVPGQKGDFTGYRETLLEDPKNSAGTSDRMIIKPIEVDKNETASFQGDIDEVLNRYGIENAAGINWDKIGDHGYITIEEAEQISNAQNNIEEVAGRSGWAPGAVDAHRADYWIRSNEYDDRIAIQNIQSDIGQDYSKNGARTGPGGPRIEVLEPAERQSDELVRGMTRRFQDLDQRIGGPGGDEEMNSIVSEMGRYGYDLAFRNSGEPYFRFHADRPRMTLEEAHGHIRTMQNGFDIEGDYDGEIADEAFRLTNQNQEELPVSPIAKDGNWKNLALRHVVLQSLRGGGKPITIPTGKQMVDVEGFGRSTHHNDSDAIKAADAYNADLVRRLQKIFRGLHPDGATVSTPAPPELQPEPLVTAISNRTAGMDRQDFLDQRVYDLEHGMVEKARNAELEGKTVDDLLDFDDPDSPSYIPPVNAMGEPDEGQGRGHFLELNDAAQQLSESDRKILGILMNGGSQRDLEVAITLGGQSDQFREAAMKAIQYDRLMKEMGNLGVHPGVVNRRDLRSKMNANASAPGWTIKPSPMAVRQALEKGLPIMSLLAPLLMSQQQEQQ